MLFNREDFFHLFSRVENNIYNYKNICNKKLVFSLFAPLSKTERLKNT